MALVITSNTTDSIRYPWQTATDGSGDVVDDSAVDMSIGEYAGDSPGSGASLGFEIASWGYWNRVLTLNELNDQLNYGIHRTPGMVLGSHFAERGGDLGIQQDISGYNNHSITPVGTVYTAHPPEFRFPPIREQRRIVKAPAVGGNALPMAWQQYRGRRAG